MSLRILLRSASALLIAGVAYVAASSGPARADEDVTPSARRHVTYHEPHRHVRHSRPARYVEQEVMPAPEYLPEPAPQLQYAPTPAPQPYYYQTQPVYQAPSYYATTTCGGCATVAPAPVYTYSRGCGGCGSAYVAPVVQPHYYASGCGTCGATVAVQPQYYAAPCGNCGVGYVQPHYANQSQCTYVNGRWLCRGLIVP